MNKLIAEEYYKTNPDDFKIFREWSKVNTKILDFENKSNLKTFKFLLGEVEGARLCEHFKYDCENSFNKLKNYLTTEQYNDMLINIFYNENLFII